MSLFLHRTLPFSPEPGDNPNKPPDKGGRKHAEGEERYRVERGTDAGDYYRQNQPCRGEKYRQPLFPGELFPGHND